MIVIIASALRIMAELLQVFQQKFAYFLDWVNYVEWVLYLSFIIFAFVFLSPCYCLPNWQWQVGAVAAFLSWMLLIIYFCNFPFTGIYITMFINISYIFWKMIILALLLVLAFTLSFYMLFHDPQAAVNTPPVVGSPETRSDFH